jgi:ATP-dependent RNA helicase DDX6/DHH1
VRTPHHLTFDVELERLQDVTQTSGYEFEDFALKRELLMGIFEKGFEKPSPIQEEAIPVILQGARTHTVRAPAPPPRPVLTSFAPLYSPRFAGQNVLARAKNGTGKTAAFCIPILQKVVTTKKKTQALVLVPSRELCMQTAAVLKGLGKYIPNLVILSLTGGGSSRDDLLRLRAGAQILVATPGKLLDMANRKDANLMSVSIIALDEADKLTSEGMLDDIQSLLSDHMVQDPAKRQLVLFSATFPASVRPFVERWMSSPTPPYNINLMDELTLKGLTQYYAFVEERQKLNCLTTLFSKLEINQSMIFCNSTARVELLAKRITEMGSSCFYIHSRMEQVDRNRVFHEFRQGNARHLVASDLCTRGIDVPSVNIVINFDFPRSSETYLHRIGRAGRFGHLGLAINLISWEDKDNMYRIEQELSTEIKPVPSVIHRNLYNA